MLVLELELVLVLVLVLELQLDLELSPPRRLRHREIRFFLLPSSFFLLPCCLAFLTLLSLPTHLPLPFLLPLTKSNPPSSAFSHPTSPI